MDDGITVRIWEVTKNVFALAKEQQRQIHTLYESHYGLIDALRREAGLDSEMREPLADPEVMRKAQLEIEQLEQLFRGSSQTPKE